MTKIWFVQLYQGTHIKKRLISVCTLQHKDVWLLTSTLVPKFIAAHEYFVYVPEEELEDFKKFTDPNFTVLSEKTLPCQYIPLLREKLIEAKNIDRYGWYFQQLLKIEALVKSEARSTIIWDADCVPVKPIKLFTNNIPQFMTASEFNPAYFLTIEKLLNIKRNQDFSFIIPGFPMLDIWIRDFIFDIESNNPGLSWYEAIINSIDFREMSGFSEFETMGTWIFENCKNEFVTTFYNWERYGQSKFGPAKTFDIAKVINIGKKFELDIISFENWDKKANFPKLKQIFRSFKSGYLEI